MKLQGILIGFVILFSQFADAQVVSEWRGLGRTGVYNESNLLEKWPEAGPELLWANEEIPDGYSSVAVAYKTVYTTGMVDTLDVVIALDMDGSIKWQTPFGLAWDESFPLSRATPTIENERLYVSSGLGDIACLNAISGEIIWKVEASKEYEGTFGRWGIAESLLIVDQKIFYTPGGDKTTIIALDKMTGETIWSSESLLDEPTYVSPLLIERGGKQIITNFTAKSFFGASVDDGTILWDFDFGSFSNDKGYNNQINTPLYHDGRIYITSGYDHKSVMLNLAEDGMSVDVHFVDTILDVHIGGVIRIGEYIYGANWLNNRMGNWVCLDWQTGEEMYNTEWYNKGAIIANNDMLYCYEEKEGHVGIAKATPEGFNIISEFQITRGEGAHWAHPVINDGVLYIRHGTALMAFDIKQK